MGFLSLVSTWMWEGHSVINHDVINYTNDANSTFFWSNFLISLLISVPNFMKVLCKRIVSKELLDQKSRTR